MKLAKPLQPSHYSDPATVSHAYKERKTRAQLKPCTPLISPAHDANYKQMAFNPTALSGPLPFFYFYFGEKELNTYNKYIPSTASVLLLLWFIGLNATCFKVVPMLQCTQTRILIQLCKKNSPIG